jgi:hypothetical protein
MINLLKPKPDVEWAHLCEQLAQQNDRLIIQSASLIQQNGYLRKANHVRPHIKLVEKARASAKLIALWHVTGYLTGRDSCFSYGMSNSYFFAGRALLVLAGVHDGDHWLTDDANRIEESLAMAAGVATKTPALLAQNMPNSKRPLEFRSAINDLPFGGNRSRRRST